MSDTPEPEITPNHRLVNRAEPPTEWCTWWADLTKLTDEIYYGWPQNDPGTNPWFWHWCTRRNCWAAYATSGHTLWTRDPLHLEPSLLWPCCGLHGFVRVGVWTPA